MSIYSHYRKEISPPAFASRFYTLKELARIYTDRLRVHIIRLQGGKSIHPKCLFGKGVKIERPWTVQMGKKCVLELNVWFNVVRDDAQLAIGDYTFIGRGSEIGVSHKVHIGNNCLISPGVFITDHNHGMDMGKPMNIQETVPSPVEIGNDVWVGANSVILPGVHIASGAVVGAGAVVNNQVSSYSIVAGVPARVIGSRNKKRF